MLAKYKQVLNLNYLKTNYYHVMILSYTSIADNRACVYVMDKTYSQSVLHLMT